MSVAALVDIVHSGTQESWAERNNAAFDGLFGFKGGRYAAGASKSVTLRAPGMTSDTGVPFAAYIDPSNPSSGPYSGLSFVIFPVHGHPALIGLIVGTQGLRDQGNCTNSASRGDSQANFGTVEVGRNGNIEKAHQFAILTDELGG